jgi:hypothetical protein
LITHEYRNVLGRAPNEGKAGGQVYDAVIAECALKASAVLLTFDVRHCRPVAARGLEIAVPSVEPG